MASDDKFYDVDEEFSFTWASDDELYHDDEELEEEEDDDELYDDDEELEEEEDDDEYDGELSEDEAAKVRGRSAKFAAITKETLADAQEEDLSTVMSLFGIKKHQARALLIRYRWKKESIMDSMERKGQERLLTEAGVVLQEESDGVGSLPVTCGVCFEDFSRSQDVSTMDCGHSFCNDCWTGYLVSSVDSGQRQIRCMALKCAAICDEVVVQQLLRREHPALAQRLRDLLLQSYADDNSAVKWCPSVPHCGLAIGVVSGGGEAEPLCEVECPCGHSFCFRCAAPAHSPCPCAMWARWEAKGVGEAENVKWLLANTKTCPRCYKPIIKDGGCNHITCKCGQCLCWLCGAATGHDHTTESIYGHTCNRFNEEEVKKVEEAKRELRRYEHYYQRFHAHADSYKAERDTLGLAISRRVAKLETYPFDEDLRDSGWLHEAHGVLLGCRQVISRSYVFAYYMFDTDVRTFPPPPGMVDLPTRQNMFEDFQGQMERVVDSLSKLLSSGHSGKSEEMLQAKAKVRDHIGTLKNLCRELYKCIEDELLPMLQEPMSIAAYGITKVEPGVAPAPSNCH